MSIHDTSISDAPLHFVLVEDNEHDRVAFRRAFRKSRHDVTITEYIRAEEALEALQNTSDHIDLIVTDYKLPGMSGLTLCEKLLGRQAPYPLVILTGAGSEHLAVDALKAGVHDYIIKDTGQGYLDLLPLVLPCRATISRSHGASTGGSRNSPHEQGVRAETDVVAKNDRPGRSCRGNDA